MSVQQIINKTITTDWKNILLNKHNINKYLKKSYDNLNKFIFDKDKTYYPIKKLIFNSLNFVNLKDIKVCIIGQDPYHSICKKTNIPHANGIAFSCNMNVKKIPPSLKNILKEMGNSNRSPDLSDLSKQGVLLLNTILTVEPHKSKSHKNKGWEEFTNFILLTLLSHNKDVIYLLLGNFAKSKINIISKINPNAKYIIAGHPSPLNRKKDFVGSNCFKKINFLLKEKIKWY